MTSLIILAVVLVVLAIFVVGIYNRLVGLRQNVNQGVADIDAQLRQRHDLIPNLVNTVKGYAGHEKETLDSVIAARNQAASGPVSSNDEAQLRVALDKLLALGEAYPDLKASANFQELQRELSNVEDKLAAARRALNAAVSRFNTARESFPAILFAGMLGFQEADFHRLDDSEKGVVDQVPDVAF
ncbi:LemA family protein [Pontixanthobacter aestiaquae]|uniref:LemA family protein n=1 Tax=Pontixanthobacter aestiaquae TaxID=1509367 RepID=A0A844Z8R4_9SPHN|nr:LemA family protein [Pontixanthobacter aestiaquae]MDN3645659.1 LemA family protein [Pontixanthobacter aestiaquae]MXO83343.1 LemA family protein [Pontixanthobacter aestiaquae]